MEIGTIVAGRTDVIGIESCSPLELGRGVRLPRILLTGRGDAGWWNKGGAD